MYLQSEILLEGKMKAVMQEFGYEGGKARLICKCENAKEAGEKAQNLGLGSRWFLPECCENLLDKNGIDVLQKTEMAVCVDGKNYLAIDEIADRLLK